MKLKLHAAIRRDLREIIARYDKVSDRAGDQFIEELNGALDQIVADPAHFHFISSTARRCNLKRFPYNIIYDVHGSTIRVAVVRHNRRHPNYGLKRKW